MATLQDYINAGKGDSTGKGRLQKFIAAGKGVDSSTLPDSILRPEVAAQPAVSTATSIAPLDRLPSVGGGETGFRSIVLGPEAETLAPKPLLERGVEFIKRAVSRKPSEFREGANELIDQAFGVPESPEDFRLQDVPGQLLRTGGRLATFVATLAPEIVERAVESSEAPPTQETLLGVDLGKGRNFLQQEVQGIVDVVMKSIETSRSVAGIGLQAAGLETKTAKDVQLRKDLLARPEETVLGLSVAAAPITGALKTRPTGLTKTVAEAPKPVVKRVKLKVEERPPLGTTRVKVAEPGRPAGVIEPTAAKPLLIKPKPPTKPTVETKTLREKAGAAKTSEAFLETVHEVPIESITVTVSRKQIIRATGQIKSTKSGEPVIVGIREGKPTVLDGNNRYYEAIDRGDKTIKVRLARDEGMEAFFADAATTKVKKQPKIQNFTQFATEKGAPSDFDLTDHGRLSPSGKRTKRGEEVGRRELLDRLDRNQKAKEEFREAVLRGEIVDPSGKVTKEGLEGASSRQQLKEVKSRLSSINSKLQDIDNLGSMSHMKSGKLRKGFQSQVDRLVAEKAQILKDFPDLRPTTEKVSEATKQKRLSEVSEQALKQIEAQKEAGITPADIKPRERISTQLTPEPTTVRQATKGIPILNIKRIAEALRSLGFNQLKPEARKGLIKSTEEAIANKQDVNALAIAIEAKESKRPLSASEQVGISLRFNEIEPQFKEASESARKLSTEGKDGAARLAQERANALREEMLTLTEAARFSGGTEVGRALQIRGRLIDENVATVLLDAAKAKGSRLTPIETKRIETAVSAKESIEKQLQEMTKKFEAEILKNEKLSAEQFINRENRRAATRRFKGKKEKILAERVDLKKQIAGLGFRLNDITGVSVEGAFLIGKLAINYAQEATLTLAQVIKKVRDDFPELTADDVIQAINTKDPRRQRKLQSEATKQVRELKTQARLLEDIRKAEQGVFDARKEKPTTPQEIRALQKKLTELRTQAFKAVTEGAKLEKALQTIDRLQDQLANQFRDVRKKRATDPAELKSAKERIASLRSDLQVTDALADVEQQLRTGDFKVKEVIEREVPIEIQRQQVKLKRARRQIRNIQENLAPKTLRSVSLEAANFARTIKATADMSATLRQGLVPTVHLLRKGKFGRLAKIQGQSIKSFFSEFTADQIDVAIRNADQHFIREQSGLYVAERGSPKANLREENFQSKFAENLPTPVGKAISAVVKASDRHMTTFLNLIRTSMFDMFLEKFPNATRTELTAWADYVNKASGRGSLRGLENNAFIKNVFFAPRFAASRFQTPAMMFTKYKTPRVRKEIVKDMAAVVSMGLATLYIADLAGADVGLNPRESDFGRIVLPSEKGEAKTRVSIFGGFQPAVRFFLQEALVVADRTGLSKVAEKGIQEVPFENVRELLSRVHESVPSSERKDPAKLFISLLRFKASPAVNIVTDLLTGKNVVGEDVTPTEVGIRALMPIIAEETREAFKKEGIGRAGVTFGLEFVGVGVNTFEDSKARVRRDVRRILSKAQKEESRGSKEKAKKLFDEAQERVDNFNLLNEKGQIDRIKTISGADTTTFDLRPTEKEKKLGLTFEERQIKVLGEKNGKRAKFIASQVKNMNAVERSAYFQNLHRKKVLTFKVNIQVRKILREEEKKRLRKR